MADNCDSCSNGTQSNLPAEPQMELGDVIPGAPDQSPAAPDCDPLSPFPATTVDSDTAPSTSANKTTPTPSLITTYFNNLIEGNEPQAKASAKELIRQAISQHKVADQYNVLIVYDETVLLRADARAGAPNSGCFPRFPTVF